VEIVVEQMAELVDATAPASEGLPRVGR
jgi:hypothetical protein